MNSNPEYRNKSFHCIIKNTNNPMKIGRRYEETFLEDMQMSGKHMRNQNPGASSAIAAAVSLFK